MYEAMCPDFGSHTMWGLLTVALNSTPAPPLLSKISSDGRTETPSPLPGMSLLGFGKNGYWERMEEVRETMGCVKGKSRRGS